MGFLLGVSTFKLMSTSLDELGIKDDSPNFGHIDSNPEIEVRQSVVHLCRIPLFPINKLYTITEKGKRDLVASDIAREIEQKLKPETPWYSYLASYLLLITGVIYGIYYLFNN